MNRASRLAAIRFARGTMTPEFLEEEIFMAQHGYLREWDEGWGGSDDRDRRRDEDRERGWRGSDRDERDRDRAPGFMLDRGRDHERGFSTMGDRAREAFRSDDHHRGEPWSSRDWRGSGQDEWRSGSEGMGGYGRFQGDQGRYQSGSSDWERAPRNYGSHQDDHYRSWRDKQMSALDRDYADYCREREQQFHQDFDNWRSNRNRQQAGQPRGSSSGDVMELSDAQAVAADQERAHERALAGQGNTPSPIGEATLGTNNSENAGTGRGKR
jgi:hypothetical protein